MPDDDGGEPRLAPLPAQDTPDSGPPWRDRMHIAGAVLVVVALIDAAAVSLFDVVSLRTYGGTGTVGQIALSGLYSLILLAGVLLLSMPARVGAMSPDVRRALFSIALAAAAFIAVALTLVAGWLAVLGLRSLMSKEASGVTTTLAGAMTLGVITAVAVQIWEASAGTTTGQPTTPAPAPTQLPLPVGLTSGPWII